MVEEARRDPPLPTALGESWGASGSTQLGSWLDRVVAMTQHHLDPKNDLVF